MVIIFFSSKIYRPKEEKGLKWRKWVIKNQNDLLLRILHDRLFWRMMAEGLCCLIGAAVYFKKVVRSLEPTFGLH